MNTENMFADPVLEFPQALSEKYRIVATCICPPIPDRQYDWVAVDDSTYDGPGSLQGFGPTEQAAIADLLERIEEREADHFARLAKASANPDLFLSEAEWEAQEQERADILQGWLCAAYSTLFTSTRENLNQTLRGRQ